MRTNNSEWYRERLCEACGESYAPTSGRQKTCMTCTPDKAWVHRWRRYRLTKPMYDKLIEKQKGLCALCLEPLQTGYNECVDHCHNSLKVRGILCRGCNMVLGRFEDHEYVERVRVYLGGDQSIAEEKEAEDLRGLQV